MVAGVGGRNCLGNRSTGACNDFEQAVKVAKQMIAAGMSSLGTVSLEDLPKSLLHREIQQIIARQQANVLEYLSPKKNLILELAEILIHEERINGEFIRTRLQEKSLNSA